MDFSLLFPALKPLVKQIFDSLIVPEIEKLEDKIGVEAVRAVVDAITDVLEAQVDKALS